MLKSPQIYGAGNFSERLYNAMHRTRDATLILNFYITLTHWNVVLYKCIAAEVSQSERKNA